METLIYLDTHVVCWLYSKSLDLLSSRACQLIEERDLYISPIVVLELEYLYEVGRVSHRSQPVIRALGQAINLHVASTSMEVVIAEALPLSWTRDPFDRIIVAQAAVGSHELLSRDEQIREHYLRAIW